LQAAVSLMLLNKNLLISTLGSQITNDFVWKAQSRFHSFTLCFVKVLYLIIWDAMTNLIWFYWNLHHLFHLTWIFVKLLYLIIWDWNWDTKDQIWIGFQDAVSMMLLSKKLLFSTISSQIMNDFVWKYITWNLLINLKLCKTTLSHNLRCKD